MYRSLDVLWYMGLDDKSRLEPYVTLQSNSEISVKDSRELGLVWYGDLY